MSAWIATNFAFIPALQATIIVAFLMPIGPAVFLTYIELKRKDRS